MNVISQLLMPRKIRASRSIWRTMLVFLFHSAQATKAQYDRMIELGLGDLDKSGVAELTFPGRGENS